MNVGRMLLCKDCAANNADELQRLYEPAVAATLSARSRTHGDFGENARLANTMRELFRTASGWDTLFPAQRLVLDECALKIARILSAVPDLKMGEQPSRQREHWHDIGGYAKLGEDACG